MVLTSEIIDGVVMGSYIVFGIVILVLAFEADKHVHKDCTDPIVRDSLNALIGLGSALLAVGFGYMVCGIKSVCYASVGTRTGEMYAILSFLVSAAILSMSSLLFTRVGKKGCSAKMKPWIIGMMSVAGISTLLSGFGIFLTFGVVTIGKT